MSDLGLPIEEDDAAVGFVWAKEYLSDAQWKFSVRVRPGHRAAAGRQASGR